ncbi:MAG: hypothetical protein Kow0080_21840 [Candidatus Promineifilaceae bacterium]
MKKAASWILKYGLFAVVGGFLLIQLVPYGRSHTNPPVIREPNWDSPQTRELAQRACFDCHSNETIWPWYSNIAPFSWLTQHDVEEGRQKLNFSEWGSGREGERAHEMAETILEGEMPPVIYLPTHPNARLTDAEKQALIAGLQSTAQQSTAQQ